MKGAVSACRDVRKVDRGFGRTRELNLRFLSCFTKALHRHLVFGQVNTVCVLELRDHPVNACVVPVVPTEVVITTGCFYFNNAVTDFKE